MPDGRVQGIDDNHRLVYIVMRGRTYAAPLAEVETKARVPSARVHFDLLRRNGVESATNVKLRTGSRTNRRHRRFGDLTGARLPGAKVDTIASRSFGVDVTTQPVRVATAWLGAMADEDFDGASALYLPGAELHTTGGSHTGRRQIRARLERCELGGTDADGAQVSGIDRYIRILWTTGDTNHITHFIIEKGQIVEQWLDVPPDVSDQDSTDAVADRAGGAAEDRQTVQLVCRGEVPDRAKEHAEVRIKHLIEQTDRPVRFARIKMTKAQNPAIDRPAMVESTLEFDKLLVRAHSTAATWNEATDLVASRLAAQIESHRDRQRHKPAGLPAERGSWRHGNLRRRDIPYFHRPESEREVVRHKSFMSDEMTIDEAAWDMALLDYDFFLFIELASGEDTLIERTDDGSLIIHHLKPGVKTFEPTATVYTESKAAPPELAVSDAIDLLDATDELLLLFRNSTSGRANVIYRRYDGHYGLITPPVDDPI